MHDIDSGQLAGSVVIAEDRHLTEPGNDAGRVIQCGGFIADYFTKHFFLSSATYQEDDLPCLPDRFTSERDALLGASWLGRYGTQLVRVE